MLDLSDLTVVEVPFKWNGREYILKEADSKADSDYKRKLLDGADFDMTTGTPRNIKNAADIEPFLVSLCLWQKDEKGNQQRVPLDVVESWPRRLVERLYAEARKISGYADHEEAEEKKP